MAEIWFHKNCDCRNATATTNQISMRQKVNVENDGIIMTVTFHPGPVCDNCGEPWIEGINPLNVPLHDKASGTIASSQASPGASGTKEGLKSNE